MINSCRSVALRGAALRHTAAAAGPMAAAEVTPLFVLLSRESSGLPGPCGRTTIPTPRPGLGQGDHPLQRDVRTSSAAPVSNSTPCDGYSVSGRHRDAD